MLFQKSLSFIRSNNIAQRKRRRLCAGGVFFGLVLFLFDAICFIIGTSLVYDKDGGIFGNRKAEVRSL
jgi:hypothetical protein